MAKPSERDIDNGTVYVLAERTIRHRIPRALRIKQRMDEGERLSDYELDYLLNLLKDVHELEPFLEEHPEWTSVAGKMARLYSEIADEAMENELKKS